MLSAPEFLWRSLPRPPGKVEHKGAILAGEQAAIVASEVWPAVNDDLRGARRGMNGMIRMPQNALLKGFSFADAVSSR
jgi:hypothetical protein